MTTFAGSRAVRMLMVRDVHGVVLGVATRRSRGKLRRAVERADEQVARGGPRVRVSRAARTYLGLVPGRDLVGHTVLAFLLLTVSASLYIGVLIRLGEQ